MSKPTHTLYSDNRREFSDLGVECLLELGNFLIGLNGRPQANRPVQAETVVSAIARHITQLQQCLDKSSSPLKRWLLNPNTRKVDPQVTRIVAYLASVSILQGHDNMPIMQVAKDCSIDKTPADILELRRVIAFLGVEGVIMVAGDGGFFAQIQLSGEVTAFLLGGSNCIPYVTNEKFCSLRDSRKNRFRNPQTTAKKAGKPQELNSVVIDFIKGMPILTPAELNAEVYKCGFVGQDEARKMMCLSAYRHMQRLRRIYVDGIDPNVLPPKSNILIRGGTATGKTLLATTLFGKVLKLPTVVVDCTTYSETGYVGEDVNTIPTKLIVDCGLPFAEIGIITLDEIDKIGDGSNNGSQRSMVSRFGVQRSLLKMLEPSGTISVPVELGCNSYRSRQVKFNLSTVLFIGLGAFSQMETSQNHRRSQIGYHDTGKPSTADGDNGSSAGANEFQSIGGFLPELYGRFGVVTRLKPLTRPQMTEILERNVIHQYRQELRLEGIRLAVDRSAITLLVEKALARGTGARGLQSELVSALQDGCFEAYSLQGRNRQIRIYADGDKIQWAVEQRRTSDKITEDEIRAIAELPLSEDATPDSELEVL